MQPKSEWHEKAIKWFVEVMNKWRKELEKSSFNYHIWFYFLRNNLTGIMIQKNMQKKIALKQNEIMSIAKKSDTFPEVTILRPLPNRLVLYTFVLNANFVVLLQVLISTIVVCNNSSEIEIIICYCHLFPFFFSSRIKSFLQI